MFTFLMKIIGDQIYLPVYPRMYYPPLWGGTNSDCSDLRQICPEFAGIKMGGMVPLYYQSNQKLNDLPGNSSKILFFQS